MADSTGSTITDSNAKDIPTESKLPPHGTPCWLHIPAHSVPRARQFYASLLNWTYAPSSEEYPAEEMAMIVYPHAKLNEAGFMGGILRVKEGKGEQVWANTGGVAEGKKPVAPLVYTWVDSVDDAVAKVEGLGGKVISGKVEEGKTGWMAVLADTEGNAIGVYQLQPGVTC
ncbi:MAG: hypothetical protein M1833_005205 [Piccolia ochrophora]|nr:MAG: hypothetical protein M1833_005205 [Piccolia ochrophora]